VPASRYPGILASWHPHPRSFRGHQSGLSSARNFPTTRADNDKRQVAGESLFSSRGGSVSFLRLWFGVGLDLQSPTPHANPSRRF